jgi:hypothetical protein
MGLYQALFKNGGEYTLARHNAIARLSLDGAPGVVALLAYLRDLKQGPADAQFRADRKLIQAQAPRKDIFSENPRVQIRHFIPQLVDALVREQAQLPVPFPRVRIAHDSMVYFYIYLLYGLFDNALDIAYAHSRHSCHILIPITVKNLISFPVARFAAAFSQQAYIAYPDILLHGLAHIVNRQSRRRNGCQRLHFDARFTLAANCGRNVYRVAA